MDHHELSSVGAYLVQQSRSLFVVERESAPGGKVRFVYSAHGVVVLIAHQIIGTGVAVVNPVYPADTHPGRS